jgi:hypothetical protein
VPLPSKEKGGKRNKTGIKRPRRPDAYPGQTSRFRLDTYDPTPPSEPPIDHGTGPYSSLYRGVPARAQREQVTRQNASVGSSMNLNGMYQGRQSRTSSLPLENPNVAVGAPSSVRGDLTMNPGPPQPVPPPQPSRGLQTQSASASLDDLTPQNPQLQSRAPTPRGPPSPVPSSHSTFVADTSMSLRERNSPGPYYRRNYDNRSITPLQESQQPSTKNALSKSSSSDTSCEYPDYIPYHQTKKFDPVQAQKKNSKAPLRIVTLLIEDIRSEPPDQQLAEVKVPLRKADDPEQGWWADAKDIVGVISLFCRVPNPISIFFSG